MKKSSLKTFLAGKNPYSRHEASLLNSITIGTACVRGEIPGDEQCQKVPGYERNWYCDVLYDGTAITYYPGD